MKKVSIITRVYNRLEYSIRCINSVKKSNYENYEHLILNNNSFDGTKEWLNFIHENNIEYFNKVNPVNLDKNYGDWGGMLKSLEYISKDSEYIIQLDNDIEILDQDWINKMIFVIENTDSKIVQLKRLGVKNVIKFKENKIKYKDDLIIYGKINRPVACFMLKTKDFISIKSKLPLDLSSGKTKISNILGNKTAKIKNSECQIIDGINTTGLNYKKYPLNLVYSKKNIL
jgi:glycosyltransferase involved in cell wall biosynthesis